MEITNDLDDLNDLNDPINTIIDAYKLPSDSKHTENIKNRNIIEESYKIERKEEYVIRINARGTIIEAPLEFANHSLPLKVWFESERSPNECFYINASPHYVHSVIDKCCPLDVHNYLMINDDNGDQIKDKIDHYAKNIVEGCIFILPSIEKRKNIIINNVSGHLCENDPDENFNNDQKFVVEVINNKIDNCGEQKDISIYTYDTHLTNVNFSLIGYTNENDHNIDLYDYIYYAKIRVSCINGDISTLSINCIEIDHKLTTNLIKPYEQYAYDLRSENNAKYCFHKDFQNFPFY